jgi:hypothetical protein
MKVYKEPKLNNSSPWWNSGCLINLVNLKVLAILHNKYQTTW